MITADQLENASLHTVQAYLQHELKARGFADETLAQKFMLFIEEVGEFAQAARKYADVKLAAGKVPPNLADEAGDVLIMFLDICNKLGVDAQTALIQKEVKNSKRVWV